MPLCCFLQCFWLYFNEKCLTSSFSILGVCSRAVWTIHHPLNHLSACLYCITDHISNQISTSLGITQVPVIARLSLPHIRAMFKAPRLEASSPEDMLTALHMSTASEHTEEDVSGRASPPLHPVSVLTLRLVSWLYYHIGLSFLFYLQRKE